MEHGWEGFRSWSLAIMQCEMKYDELFTHKDIYYYVLLSIMTIAKLPHTQRLHFSHLSVCGLLFAASHIKWRDNKMITCQTKLRRLQSQIKCEWKLYDVCIHWMQPRLSSHVMTMLTITECHARGFIVTMSHVTRTVILSLLFCMDTAFSSSVVFDGVFVTC